MLAAVEFVADRDDRRFLDPYQKIGPHLSAAMLACGAIACAITQGNILGFSPPFCLTDAECYRIIDATTAAVGNVLG